MSPTLQINFDNVTGIFFPGQTITGHLQVYCNDDFKCRAIFVKFKGVSFVQWSEEKSRGTGKNREFYTESYEDREEYYNIPFKVWGDDYTSYLPIGQQNYPFAFTLPPYIPSSFEVEHGYVRHTCTAKLDVPWGFDKKYKKLYSVIDMYDLNMDPESMVPISKQKSKTLCCLCCASGPMSFVLRIDKSGYVPGENIYIDAECTNHTRRVVQKTKVKLCQDIVLKAKGHAKHVTREVLFQKREPIQPGSSDVWSAIPFKVPPIPASHLKHCNIIDILYTLKFSMHPAGIHLTLSTTVPIVIGTIPLQQSFGHFTPGNPGFSQQTGGMQLQYLGGMQRQYPEGIQPAYSGRMQPSAPGGMQPSAPGGIQSLLPNGIHPSAPGGMQPSAPGGIQSLLPDGMQPSASGGMQPSAPGEIQPQYPGGIPPPNADGVQPPYADGVQPSALDGMPLLNPPPPHSSPSPYADGVQPSAPDGMPHLNPPPPHSSPSPYADGVQPSAPDGMPHLNPPPPHSSPSPYPGGSGTNLPPIGFVSPLSDITPSAPFYGGVPGVEKYPNLPMPSFNSCPFGSSTFNKNDNESNIGENYKYWTPQYISYNVGE